MKAFLNILLGACAASCVASAAAQAVHPTAATPGAIPVLPPVAQADAMVPPVAYRSVFGETSLGVEQEQDDWRQANERVGRFKRGHVDILKEEQAQDGAKPVGLAPGSVGAAQPAAGHRH